MCSSLPQSLFRRDQIRFLFVPVRSYEHLREQAAHYLVAGSDFKSIVLINCGAIVDVASFLQLSADAEQAAFVIDYHRPVHRSNIDNTSNVVVFADTETVPDPRPQTRAPVEDQELEHSGDSPSKVRFGVCCVKRASTQPSRL